VAHCARFYVVGALGIVVQLAALTLLKSGFQMDYLLATALAVEVAVLHNFFWHEHWTWADRTRRVSTGRASRLVRFHLTNGAVSVLGNLVLMQLLVGRAGVPYLYASLLSIAVCSLLNFVAADRLVFSVAANARL
jgi:putative flippase GtrA